MKCEAAPSNTDAAGILRIDSGRWTAASETDIGDGSMEHEKYVENSESGRPHCLPSVMLANRCESEIPKIPPLSWCWKPTKR